VELQRLSPSDDIYGCRDRHCPTVYRSDRDSYVIQGFTIDDVDVLRQLDLPPGESVVEIPASLLAALANEGALS
jgi:hypothetical protein